MASKARQTRHHHGVEVFDVVVILNAAAREDPVAVGSLLVSNSENVHYQLGELADIRERSGPYEIRHVGGQRAQSVTCNVSGRALTSLVAEAEKEIAEHVRFSPGNYFVVTGAAAERAHARNQILVHSVVAGIAILLLLAIAIPNWRSLLLMVANLPFAMVGGVLAVWLTGGALSIGSLVGFVTLLNLLVLPALALKYARFESNET